jgi:hypothetical protein
MCKWLVPLVGSGPVASVALVAREGRVMRMPARFSDSGLRDARDAAGVVASGRFRACLPGRLLPVLVARLRDDAAEALGELASSELAELPGAVALALVGRA